MSDNKSLEKHDIQTDILIIGGGGAGLPAATRAFEAGAAKVTIIENRGVMGGTARMAGGMFAVESPAQKRLGIHDTVDDIFKKHMEGTNWMCEARLVRNWINKSKDVIRWLEEKGVIFDKVFAFSGTTKVYHQVREIMSGNKIMNTLLKECEDKGAQILLKTRAQKLLKDEKGNVNGVLATQNGKEIRIKAKSVVIATGSISANKQLLKKYYPEISFDDIKIMANTKNSTGDGLLMAQEAGAARDALMSTLWIGPHNYPHNMHVGLIARRPHMMYVNKYGMRYADESLWIRKDYGWYAGTALERQPGRICYALFDEKTKQDMIRSRKNISIMEDMAGMAASGAPPDAERGDGEIMPLDMDMDKADPAAWFDKLEDDIQSEIAGKRLKKSDSLDEIAEWMGADAAVLKKTVAEYNVFCMNSYDADFLKPKEWLKPLSTPPYYAILAHEGVDTCIGGIRISHRMEVLDTELKPINGLYAAGVATSGWLGPLYSFGGSELGFTMYSGYTVGEIAAEYAKSKGE